MMKRRTLLAASTAAMAAPALPARAQGKTKITFWYGLSGALGEEVVRVCRNFNAAQNEAEIEPVFKGSYVETLTSSIAAWRAGQAPHMVQMFEVGTGSMLAAGPAMKQVWQLSQETGVKIDPSVYIPGVRGYYSLPDGRLASMPFNSSTAMMWINKDAFQRAGLDPAKPPTTWQGVVEAARAIKARNAAPIPMTTAWPTWVHFEQYGAMHNQPFATKGNGFDGLDTELRINAPAYTKHLQRLLDMGKEGLFRWGGRDNAAEPLFVSGEAAIQFTSSAGRAAIARDAKFNWAMAMLPTDPEVNPNPINSVIGGASIWTMTAPNRTLAEYRAVANFFAYISQPAVDAEWHQRTGYVPVTSAAYEVSKGQGFYEKTPGTDLPILQLSRGQLSENSRGFRLGRMVELRNIIQEEMERALQGQQTAQAALDSAVQRGNRVLREFERTARG